MASEPINAMTARYHGERALVVGGSIGGLTAALLLRQLGFHVSVFERTPTDLDNRGGGIVLQPETLRWFREFSAQQPAHVSTFTQYVQYLGPDNSVLHHEHNPWSYTSWATFYRALLADFGTEHYHLGEYATGYDQTDKDVEVRFASGRRERAEIVVFADGIASVGRARMSPGTDLTYAGYVGWRGTVHESLVSPETFALLRDAITYSAGQNTHIIIYPIPAPDFGLAPGERLLNFVWYRNVAEGADLNELMTDRRGFPVKVSLHPGTVQERFVAEMKHTAVKLLAPAAAEVVCKTEEPYIQAIYDSAVDHMADGRVALIGDAAAAARPHAAAGTAKAAENAWSLFEALSSGNGDIAEALAKWEPRQLELNRRLVERVSAMGARSQFHNNWTPGDPELAFGLYGPRGSNYQEKQRN